MKILTQQKINWTLKNKTFLQLKSNTVFQSGIVVANIKKLSLIYFFRNKNIIYPSWMLKNKKQFLFFMTSKRMFQEFASNWQINRFWMYFFYNYLLINKEKIKILKGRFLTYKPNYAVIGIYGLMLKVKWDQMTIKDLFKYYKWKKFNWFFKLKLLKYHIENNNKLFNISVSWKKSFILLQK